jgi:UDP:flavonoid glycosyltransferase YjiC (YdhE family)
MSLSTSPSADLDAYIDTGDPPVLVTLGTSAATDAAERFARIRAAVVSGAYGSVAAAVTAGIPTVHPQWSDQFWHGRQVRTLGVTVEAIERAIGTTA